MVTINLGNSAGSTASASYTLSEGCSDSIINGMIPSVEWMTATASNGTISITATEDNPTTSERSGYITPLINGESCTNNRFKVTQEAGEEPEPPDPPDPPIPVGCTCLVDNCAEEGNLHALPLDAGSGSNCDKAWAEHPENYRVEGIYYSTSSTGSWTKRTDGWLRAEVTDVTSCPGVSNKQANYVYEENDTGAERWAKVHWMWNGDTREDGFCSESWAYLKQEAGGGGGGGDCTCSGLNIKSAISFVADGGSQTIGYTPSDCSVSVYSKPEWLTVTDNGNGTFTAKAEKNTGGRKEGAIKWSVDGSDAGCPSTDVSQEGSGGGTLDKTVSIALTVTNDNLYMNSITTKISLQPKSVGGRSVTLWETNWINEPECDKWTKTLTKNSVTLQGSYTGNINEYNFQVNFQTRTLKKKEGSGCGSLSPTNATKGHLGGVGSGGDMNSSSGIISVPLESESNIGSNISITIGQ